MPIYNDYFGHSVQYDATQEVLTTIGGIPIPHKSYFWLDPWFVKNFKEAPNGYSAFNLDEIRLWVIDNWTQIQAESTPRRYLRTLLSSILYVDGTLTEIRDQTSLLGLPYCKVRSDQNTSSFVLVQTETPIVSEFKIILQTYNQVKLVPVPTPTETLPIESYYLVTNNYSYTPDPDFRSLVTEKQELYFGLELEISTKLSVEELQHVVTEVEPKQEPFFYCKSDSSVNGRYSNKVELVTHPMTPKVQRLEWSKFFKKIDKLLAGRNLSDFFDTSGELNNGLHIHLSDSAFIENRGNFHRRRFLTFWNQWDMGFKRWLKVVSKRHDISGQYFAPHPELNKYVLSERMRKDISNGRNNAAAQRSGKRTVEVRVFQGIFDMTHVMSCIEITEASFYFTINCPYSAFGRGFADTFGKYVMDQKGYKYAKETLRCA